MVDCDGQVLVMHDVLGLSYSFLPRFAKSFTHVWQDASIAAGTISAKYGPLLAVVRRSTVWGQAEVGVEFDSARMETRTLLAAPSLVTAPNYYLTGRRDPTISPAIRVLSQPVR